MQLNIKNADTARMAKKLAELRGLPVARVVQDALRRELAAEQTDREAVASAREKDAQAVVARVRARLAATGRPIPDAGEGDDWLYDADGLPR
jgi:hypothetical protein